MEKIIKTEMNEDNKREINKIVMLEEMIDSMKQSKENGARLIAQQTKLIDILVKSEDGEFKELIEATKQQNEKLEDQIEVIDYRLGLFDHILKECEKDTEKALVLNVLDAFGIFDNQ